MESLLISSTRQLLVGRLELSRSYSSMKLANRDSWWIISDWRNICPSESSHGTNASNASNNDLGYGEDNIPSCLHFYWPTPRSIYYSCCKVKFLRRRTMQSEIPFQALWLLDPSRICRCRCSCCYILWKVPPAKNLGCCVGKNFCPFLLRSFVVSVENFESEQSANDISSS